MSTTERDTQKEELRERIVEAARDIVSEQGLDALSMRALALRIGHSPGTIYHHFQDKDELLGSVMAEGFKRLGESMEREIAKVGSSAPPLEQYAAKGRGYARFALENTGYFQAMFEMPAVAQLDACPEGPAPVGVGAERSSWGLIHGLTSLYVSGHLMEEARTHDEFMELVESAIQALGAGWRAPCKGGVLLPETLRLPTASHVIANRRAGAEVALTTPHSRPWSAARWSSGRDTPSETTTSSWTVPAAILPGSR